MVVYLPNIVQQERNIEIDTCFIYLTGSCFETVLDRLQYN